MMSEKEQPITKFDVDMIVNRHTIIIGLYERGQIDTESFVALWEGTMSLDTIMEEREAFLKELNGELDDHNDSPLGRLGGLFFKLKPEVYDNGFGKEGE